MDDLQLRLALRPGAIAAPGDAEAVATAATSRSLRRARPRRRAARPRTGSCPKGYPAAASADRIRWQTRRMLRRLLLLAAFASLLTACGSSGKHSTSHETTTGATTTTATTGAAATRTVETFFFRTERADAGADTGPATRRPSRTSALERPARRAARRLHDRDPERRDASLRGDRRRHGDGVVLDSSLGSPTRSAQGQIVSTLTQFPTVRRVVDRRRRQRRCRCETARAGRCRTVRPRPTTST